ncbi:MAG: hypothetical protein K2N34_14100 [Lachnospiraceae bacterium]|nr:hypothetical protein [Lachnospiraceae bacterium]
MDKELLVETLEHIGTSAYSWALYFFKIDRRNYNLYTAFKIRFKNNQYLPKYAKSLVDMAIKYQLEKITDIKAHMGENTKGQSDY